MIVQFFKPVATAKGNNPPDGLIARASVHHVSPLLPDMAIAFTIWQGDGSKGRPKGVLSVGLPQYGAIAGRPVRIPATTDEDGNEAPESTRQAKAGQEQISALQDAILDTFTSARRHGKEYDGRYELIVPGRWIVEPATTAKPEPVMDAMTDTELERATAPNVGAHAE